MAPGPWHRGWENQEKEKKGQRGGSSRGGGSGGSGPDVHAQLAAAQAKAAQVTKQFTDYKAAQSKRPSRSVSPTESIEPVPAPLAETDQLEKRLAQLKASRAALSQTGLASDLTWVDAEITSVTAALAHAKPLPDRLKAADAAVKFEQSRRERNIAHV